ncbi:MAG: signal recognition particle-docking protein FtsY [Firmicutes bacterium]|nr:signal recognition particle-docking protein FtsY [Bacillota bacterium]
MAEEVEKTVDEAAEEIEKIEEKAEEAVEELKEEIEEIAETEESAAETVAETEETLEESVEETESVEEVAEEPVEKLGFFDKIKAGLSKTRSNIMSGVENVLKAFTTIDEDLYEELEEALIMADIGVDTSVSIIEQLRERVKEQKIKEPEKVKDVLVEVITDILQADKTEFELSSPSVVIMIGVNGVGKTTTIGKLANNFKKEGKSVMLAAADTFRAAAIDQLEIWGERNDVQVIRHQENSDPGAVVYDAIQSAKSKKTDVLLCDTAGRLHNKKNLMEELKKIFRIIDREYPDAQREVLLVLDATTGQNALQQAKLFKEAADITGIVLTKLDGTAKGGIVIAIKNELKVPVRYIGVGEGIDDLRPFDENEFARALFEE